MVLLSTRLIVAGTAKQNRLRAGLPGGSSGGDGGELNSGKALFLLLPSFLKWLAMGNKSLFLSMLI